MKIRDFEPLSLIDFPGEPAVVVFTQGCNMACPYCHNKSLIPNEPAGVIPHDAMLRELRDRRPMTPAVVVTGGEPTLQSGLQAFLADAKFSYGMRTKLDTNGSQPDLIRVLLASGCLDYVALDLKAPDAVGYDRLGAEYWVFGAVLKTLALLDNSGIEYEVRTTCDPRFVNEANVANLAAITRGGRAKHYLQAPTGMGVDLHVLIRAAGQSHIQLR